MASQKDGTTQAIVPLKNTNKDDDDEENDEDYNPELDAHAKEEEDDDDEIMADTNNTVLGVSFLSSIQEREVDRAFEKLFGYKWGQAFELPLQLNRREKILVRVLGATAAASVLRNSNSIIGTKKRPHSARQTFRKPQVGLSGIVATTSGAGGQRQQDYKPPENTATTEAATSSTTAASSKGGGVGVDKLLKDLSGPNKVTTISKTSNDWESFKSETGLANKLEEQAQSKDAYLNRQDFLQRVDHRRFEAERKDRDAERSKRGL